jgi:NAD(P)H-flavin reductase/hemoglobin-like flavoprotein
VVDAARLRESWDVVARYGDQVPLHFYSYLFVAHPETRDMFPLSMAAQRDRLVGALAQVVANVDRVDELVPLLQQLGRDHRKFGVLAAHYAPVGEALLATLRQFLGERWSAELAAEWTGAYEVIANVMTQAAEESALGSPPWWDAEVTAHERRGLDIAVLTVRPQPAYEYRPGQSMAVECQQRPKVWRLYSPANAPRQDGTFDLHVRQAIGGSVSTALVNAVRTGDVLRIGPPIGERLTLAADDPRDVLLIAGGTGLAPLKAIAEQVAYEYVTGVGRRRVALVLGARTERDLYDQAALREMDRSYPWLTVLPALSADQLTGLERGSAVDVALRRNLWQGREMVYVCGSDQMVAGSLKRLVGAGVPESEIRYETFQRPEVAPEVWKDDQR